MGGPYRGAASSSPLQGAAEHGLQKIPEPIKEATALFYGKDGLTCLPGSDVQGRSRERGRGAMVRVLVPEGHSSSSEARTPNSSNLRGG